MIHRLSLQIPKRSIPPGPLSLAFKSILRSTFLVSVSPDDSERRVCHADAASGTTRTASTAVELQSAQHFADLASVSCCALHRSLPLLCFLAVLLILPGRPTASGT